MTPSPLASYPFVSQVSGSESPSVSVASTAWDAAGAAFGPSDGTAATALVAASAAAASEPNTVRKAGRGLIQISLGR